MTKMASNGNPGEKKKERRRKEITDVKDSPTPPTLRPTPTPTPSPHVGSEKPRIEKLILSHFLVCLLVHVLCALFACSLVLK